MEFTITNIATLCTALLGGGSFIAFLFEKRKNKAVAEGLETDNESKDIDNGKKVIDIYKKALDDMGGRYEKKFKEFIDLYERKVKVLEDEIKLHKRINNNLKRENTDLRKQLNERNSSK